MASQHECSLVRVISNPKNLLIGQPILGQPVVIATKDFQGHLLLCTFHGQILILDT